MDDYAVRLERISGQLQQLSQQLNDNERQQQELVAEREELKRMLEEKNRTIADLQHQNNLLSIAGRLKGGETENTAELKRRINEFIKEIDKCVALLNN